MTPSKAVAHELRARLSDSHDALTRMGTLSEFAAVEMSWFRRTASDDVAVWWMHGAGSLRSNSDADARRLHFRDGAEGLVLLSRLARIDYEAFVHVLREVWPRGVHPDRKIVRRGSRTHRCAIGLDYAIYATADLAPLTERIVGIDPPTKKFIDAVAWLKTNVPSLRIGATQARSIPIRIRVSLFDETASDLAFVLRQILQNVITQQLHQHIPKHSDATQAAAVTRFQIVDVDVAVQITPVNVESLQCLARLSQLGIRVRRLPTIQIENASIQDKLTMTKCLEELLPPVRAAASPSPIKYVYATDETSLHAIPAIFTAIQSSQGVEDVEVVVQRPVGTRTSDAELAAVAMWKWSAYTLFSRQGAAAVKTVSLHVDHLDESVLEMMRDIFCAENPLTELFSDAVRDRQWVASSRFHLEKPTDGPGQSDGSLFLTDKELVVPVLSRAGKEGASWLSVLLPRHGEAWVKADEATDVVSEDGRLQETSPSPGPIHIKLEGFDRENRDDVLAFLRLVPRGIECIELAVVDREDVGYDLTEWTLDALRSLPHLQRLEFPFYIEISKLQCLVGAAEAGYSRLRCLSLGQTFEINASDIVDFLHVLTDASHPLTQHLEELCFTVSYNEAVPSTFATAWRRLLDQNRSLHTISLTIVGPERVERDRQQVAIRTGPLALTSKLAFLSVIHHDANSRDRARCRLDASVMADVFRFAAAHRVRKVMIEIDRDYD